MIRTIIIDDELSMLETLEIELGEYCPDVKVIAKCNSARAGIQAIREIEPELVFLDIEMPKMNGFELLQEFDQINFDVIFVTAYDKYAIKAFEVNALDYLLKPIQKHKLIQAVEKAEQKQDRGLSPEDLQKIISSLQSSTVKFNNIALPTLEGYEFVKVSTIIFAQADSNYTTIFLESGRKMILSKTLKEIEALLEGFPFIRTHQSYLINIDHILKYIKGSGGYVILSNGESVSVSRNYKKQVLEIFKRQ